MVDISFYIEHWFAWAPGLNSLPEWKEWAMGSREILPEGQADVKFVPPMQRRRFSRLTKMSLLAANQANTVGDNVITIFGSRHGEFHRTSQLLESLIEQEPLSPTAFSMSVHNTASGLYSILTGNKQPSTSIAAGVQTLEQCFIEAYGWLKSEESDRVLVVIADEPVPGNYEQFIDYQEYSVAAAFLVSLNKPNDEPARKANLKLTSCSATLKCSEMPVLSLLRLMLSENDDCQVINGNSNWCWKSELQN
ncbi:beta-ketoacyl synthase chain length factor [Pleionea sediminis]|uniref:beta-ketoacyl synthase chain length factor n=1 Tax=Pleionea sediminis TaxID=2569479 RepID=UPI0011848152|nr:beta-ketoacyl synthase chain length factor [Pleionea sediminis]